MKPKALMLSKKSVGTDIVEVSIVEVGMVEVDVEKGVVLALLDMKANKALQAQRV